MSTPLLTRLDDHQYAVAGELNMQTVPAIAKTAAELLTNCQGVITIDLSAVSRADSAGLALLIDWLRLARQFQYEIQFKSLPAQLMQIARVSELHEILPIQSS